MDIVDGLIELTGSNSVIGRSIVVGVHQTSTNFDNSFSVSLDILDSFWNQLETTEPLQSGNITSLHMTIVNVVVVWCKWFF